MQLSHGAISILFVGLIIMHSGVVSSQDYPSKPIRIVTAAAGGGSDFASRLIAQGISGPLGQPVIVENRGGAVLQGEYVYKAPPDGYSLMVTGNSFWVGSLLQKYSYDVVSDFSPISALVREVSILVVHPSLPANSIKQLIAVAKSRPGELNYSSGSIGGPPHLAGELFKSMAGVNIVHVPYKGLAPAVNAVISGEAQMMISAVGAVTPYVKSGKLKALAVTSVEPSPLAPGLPTVAASGLIGYEADSVTGVLASSKTPSSIINRLSQEIARFIQTPEAKEKFLLFGMDTVGGSPAQFAAIIKSDIVRLGKVIRDAGIKLE